MLRPRRKLTLPEFIEAHPRCCYCNGRRATAERDHAPARIVFIKKHGPEGYEFPSCAECNRLTALSEQIAALYIRMFDNDADRLEVADFAKMVEAVSNNAKGALPVFPEDRTLPNPMLDPAGVYKRTVTVPRLAHEHMKLFAQKILYAIYYKTTGKFAGSSNRYMVLWAQTGTEAADTMTNNANAWFDKHHTGERPNVDLGNQFKYQTGYSEAHGYFGIKMSFSGSFVFFGVVGPARGLAAMKPKLPLCPAISDIGKRLNNRKP